VPKGEVLAGPGRTARAPLRRDRHRRGDARPLWFRRERALYAAVYLPARSRHPPAQCGQKDRL